MTERERKTIEWLHEYAGIDERIDRLENEVERLRTRLEGIGAQVIDGMPKAHDRKKGPEKLILELEKLDTELTTEILNLRKKRLDILEAVNSIQEPRLQVLIEYRYIDFKHWEEICHDLHCSWDTVHRWHREAIRKIKVRTQSYTDL